ncbi:MAG TPA: hypothetical protein VKZ63_10930 [Kofleriaceae bacterium]|nr:hypothetical protein [Kofleriaceae bacterium]
MIAVGCLARGPGLALAVLAGTAVACSEPHEPAPSSDPVDKGSAAAPSAGAEEARAEPVAPKADAGPREASAADGRSTASVPGGFHLDEPEVEYQPARRESRARRGRPIEIVLRSTPPGAVAAVDGVAVGPTPALWEGTADGRAREFTFVLPGHAIARYRFVPTQSGVVHGSLDPLKSMLDAGPGGDEGAADR